MRDILSALGLQDSSPGAFGKSTISSSSGREVRVVSPANGAELGRVAVADGAAYDRVVSDALEVFKEWRKGGRSKVSLLNESYGPVKKHIAPARVRG